MKKILFIICICFFAYSCNSSKKTLNSNSDDAKIAQNDTLKITGENLDYDIIIIEPGFNIWLKSVAKPEGFYDLEFLKNKNMRYVAEWNRRAVQPTVYDSTLYEMQINYESNIDYGYDINYKLYNYFIFFQNTHKQNLLGGYIPTN